MKINFHLILSHISLCTYTSQGYYAHDPLNCEPFVDPVGLQQCKGRVHPAKRCVLEMGHSKDQLWKATFTLKKQDVRFSHYAEGGRQTWGAFAAIYMIGHKANWLVCRVLAQIAHFHLPCARDFFSC